MSGDAAAGGGRADEVGDRVPESDAFRARFIPRCVGLAVSIQLALLR